MNYESLDRIRVEQECFIDFDRKNSEFVVLGRKDNNVAIAISRIYGVFCEIAARNRLPTKGNLVEPPQKQELLSDVYLDRRHSLVNRQITFKVHVDNSGAQCHLTGHTPPMVRGPFADWESKRSSILRANHLYLRKVVQQALNDLIYIRSHVTMKVNFGTLVLFAYQQPKENVFPLMEFMQMLRGKQTQTELLRQ